MGVLFRVRGWSGFVLSIPVKILGVRWFQFRNKVVKSTTLTWWG